MPWAFERDPYLAASATGTIRARKVRRAGDVPAAIDMAEEPRGTGTLRAVAEHDRPTGPTRTGGERSIAWSKMISTDTRNFQGSEAFVVERRVRSQVRSRNQCHLRWHGREGIVTRFALFLSSYVPLFLMLAFRFTEAWLVFICIALAIIGSALGVWILYPSRDRSGGTITVRHGLRRR